MHFRHLALAGALTFTACEVGASVVRNDLPVDLIASCLTELSELADTKDHSAPRKFDLNKHCPELAKQLALSLDAGAFGSVRIDATSIEGLRDLQFLAAGFDRRPPSLGEFRLDFDGLDALLADVLIEEKTDDSMWEQFLRWLEQYAKEGDSGDFSRFLDWLGGLDAPPWLADVLLKISVVLIVLLALMVIGNELWLAGVLRRARHPRSAQATGGTTDAAPKSRAVSLDELRALPARQMAAAILEIVTAALVDRGWLSSSSSLTNGELVRQLGKQQRGIAGAFTDLVDGIEKVIYGDRLPDDESRQRLITTAREVIELARGSSSVAPQESR